MRSSARDTRLLSYFGLALTVGIIAPTSLAAQSIELSDPAQKIECRTVANALNAAPSEVNRIDVAKLYRCSDTGPAALAKLWQRPPHEVSAFSTMLLVSGEMPDKRVLKVLLSIATDTSATRTLRTAAIATMGAYIDSTYGSTAEVESTEPEGFRVSFAKRTHAGRRVGTAPIDAADVETIRRTSKQIAASERDFLIRRLATEVAALSSASD